MLTRRTFTEVRASYSDDVVTLHSKQNIESQNQLNKLDPLDARRLQLALHHSS